jgi:RNA polymerase-binding transcription factor DksA
MQFVFRLDCSFFNPILTHLNTFQEDAMASGWANDDAVNEQINSTIEDAVARARGEIPRGESLRNAKSAENRSRRRGEKPFQG